MLALYSGHAFGIHARRVVARAADDPANVGFQVVVQGHQMRIVGGLHDGMMELVVLFIAQLVIEQRVLHSDQRLAHLLQVRVGAALRGVARGGDLNGEHQFQDVFQILIVARGRCGNPECVLLEVRVDEDPAALLRRDQAFGLQARQRFAHDGAADRIGFGQLLFRGQAIAGREHTLAYLLRQRVTQRR
ncbi:hypothetical protein A7J71_05500 [Achromobacter insolitus]|nr:hypothetical protein A7J71_05500 [Achromobacter insolitus]